MTVFDLWENPAGGTALSEPPGAPHTESPFPSDLSHFGDFTSRTIEALAQLGPGMITAIVNGVENPQIVGVVPHGVTHLVSASFKASAETEAGTKAKEEALKVEVKDSSNVLAEHVLEANLKTGESFSLPPVVGKTVAPGDEIAVELVEEPESPATSLKGVLTLHFA